MSNRVFGKALVVESLPYPGSGRSEVWTRKVRLRVKTHSNLSFNKCHSPSYIFTEDLDPDLLTNGGDSLRHFSEGLSSYVKLKITIVGSALSVSVLYRQKSVKNDFLSYKRVETVKEDEFSS